MLVDVREERPAILIVDDNPDIRSLVSIFLRHAGFRVVEAEDGEAALEFVLSEPPALVVCDDSMPRMSGRTLLSKLKASALTESVPVIMVTGSGLTEESEWCRRGAAILLRKPFRMLELVSAVQRLVPVPTRS